jgi:ABC-2 type transport system ATP-binding protein/ribosome-dependent ATPase
MIAELRDVTKQFGSVTAVDDVSFGVAAGEVVGLLGANGAGKTTAIRALLGLIAPTGGSVHLFGGPPDRLAVRRVGYVPQGLGLYTDLTARENLSFQAGVYDFEPSSPPVDLADWWDVTVERMPFGVRRRVAFEVALAHRPELLVLDEPTSGVGPLGRARLWDTIRSNADEGIGVLVTTHYLEEAEQCDRLVMMAGGRVVAEGLLDDVIGDRTAVIVRRSDWRRVAEVLEAAGERVSATADGVRVAGGDAQRIARLLAESGVPGDVGIVGGTLEETFVDLAS